MKPSDPIAYARSLERKLLEVAPWIAITDCDPPIGIWFEAAWIFDDETGCERLDVYIMPKDSRSCITLQGEVRGMPDFWRLQQDVPS